MRKVLSIKQQAELFDNVLQQRLDDLLPTLMKRQGISMWIVMNREYNEDPVTSPWCRPWHGTPAGCPA